MPPTPKRAKLSVILLAAGSSSRLGQPKQLLPVNNVTLVRQRAAAITAAFGDEVDMLVVTGAKRQEVLKELEGLSFKEAYNSQFEDGMSGSIKAALLLIPHASDAAMFVLVDQPFVSDKHLKALERQWRSSPDKVVAAAYSGILGVPAIFPARYFDRLQSLQGDQGARKILARLPADEVIAYPLPEASVDIDTPEDLKAIGL